MLESINISLTIDNYPDPIAIINTEHQVIAWNKALTIISGISKEQAQAMTLEQRNNIWLADVIINPSLELKYDNKINHKHEQLYAVKEVFSSVRESTTQLYLQATPIYNGNGQIIAAIEIAIDSQFLTNPSQPDIEARQQLEAAYQQITAIEEELRQQFDELQHTTAIQQESERRFRTMLEGVQLVAVILDLQSIIKFVNDYVLELTGWQREEVLGKPYLDVFFPAEFRERVNQWFKDAIELPENIKYGYAPLQTRSGEYRYLDWNSTQLFDGNGNLEGLAIVGSNVTERVEAEAELRKQLDYTNTMIDNLNEMFYTFDLDMRLTFINKKSNDFIGYSPDELIGTLFNSSQVATEDWEWIKTETTRRLMTGESASYVLPWLHRDGHRIYLKINSTAIWENGRIIGGMVLADDITSDIKSSEKLRASEENLRRVTDHMLDLIAEIDLKGNLIYISPSHQKLLGYTDGQMREMRFKQLVHPHDLARVLARRGKVLATSQPFTSEQRLRRAEGSYVWTETLGNPVKIEDKLVGYILCTRDITSRKQLEQELRYLNVHDVLTSLYNRTYFEEQMERLEAENEKPVGMMICDLDGLKLVNDTLGHAAGDLALKKTGEILRSCFRDNDIVARIGGDEFAVLLPQTD
ncbi:MAG: PAS domain S-box protein, partial [Methylocystaceae bacterium]